MMTKQGNKPEIDNSWRHLCVILHFSKSSQRHKASLYFHYIPLVWHVKYILLSHFIKITLKNQLYGVTSYLKKLHRKMKSLH